MSEWVMMRYCLRLETPFEITGESGSGCPAYATVVDNGTDDATLVPAQAE